MTSDKILVVSDSVCLKDWTDAETNVNFTNAARKNHTSAYESCSDDFLIPDFQLAKFKALKAKQRVASRNQEPNGIQNPMPFEGLIQFMKGMGVRYSNA